MRETILVRLFPTPSDSQAYITFPDRAFAVATVQAIGRVACAISEVTETCLHGLMSLLSNKDGVCVRVCVCLSVHVRLSVCACVFDFDVFAVLAQTPAFQQDPH